MNELTDSRLVERRECVVKYYLELILFTFNSGLNLMYKNQTIYDGYIIYKTKTCVIIL